MSSIKHLKQQIKELQDRMAALSTDVESLLSEKEEEEEQEEQEKQKEKIHTTPQKEEPIELEVVFSPTLHPFEVVNDLFLFESEEDEPQESLKNGVALYETDIDF